MTKMENMGGFFVAAITPFDENGQFNAKALHALMDRTIAQGAAGFLIGGSSAAACASPNSGEADAMTMGRSRGVS